MPIKKLSPAELNERKAKGLCFNGNDKFSPGHRCKKLFLIEGENDDITNKNENSRIHP